MLTATIYHQAYISGSGMTLSLKGSAPCISFSISPTGPIIINQPLNFNLAVKAILQGPYVASTGMMHDSSRVKNLNPAVDRTTVVYENLLDTTEGDLFVTVVDSRSSRELVRKKVKMGAGEFSIDLSLEDLTEGSYLVHIEKDGLRIGSAQKLMVVK